MPLLQLHAALASGCALTRYTPEAEKALECPPGQRQSGIRSLLDNEGWVKTPEAIGDQWLARQGNRDEFAATKPNPTRQSGDTLLVTDRDGCRYGKIRRLVRAHGRPVRLLNGIQVLRGT